jgi:hypothetical protein
MEDKPLRPFVQHGEHADRAADPARIASEFDIVCSFAINDGLDADDTLTRFPQAIPPLCTA